MANLILSILVLGLAAQSFARIPTVLKVWPARIVGGEPAQPGELPFQLSLRYFGSHICGASILSKDLIVTAAHCADNTAYQNVGDAESFSVVAGDRDRNTEEGTEQVRDVETVLMHEDYDDWLISNDIALMWLSESLDLNGNVQPIAVPAPNHLATGPAVVSGWGTTTEDGEAAEILQKVTVPIVSDEECREAYGDEEVFDSMICAGAPEGGKDSCQGDSGGPMTATDLGTRYLAGIVSWGYGCARPGFPGVYTEVSHFVEWINEHV